MGLGTCRHCDAADIASDAAYCRNCKGWRPNPGFFSRFALAFNRCFSVVVLLALGAAALWVYNRESSGQMPQNTAYLLYAGCALFGFSLAWYLFWSLVYPYGRPPGVRDGE